MGQVFFYLGITFLVMTLSDYFRDLTKLWQDSVLRLSLHEKFVQRPQENSDQTKLFKFFERVIGLIAPPPSLLTRAVAVM